MITLLSQLHVVKYSMEMNGQGRPANTWRIELFGGLTARRDEQVIDRFPTQKVGALLAMLAFYPRQRHTREELIDMLWPDADLSAARNRLSQALVWLRPQLEPEGVVRGSVLLADRVHIGLAPTAFTTDVADFDLLVKNGQRDLTPSDRRDLLTQAVALYRGSLLAGYYNDWILDERQRLLDAYLSALRALVGSHEQLGESEIALGFARRALSEDPLQEEAHVDVIRLLAESGQSAAALRQFQELRRILSKELGDEPSPATLALVESIKSNPTVTHIAPIAAPVRVTPLPAPLTRLFGRDEEIQRVHQTLLAGGARLVTLIGPGGAGKTRLALAAGASIESDWPDGVVFVPLADMDAPPMILTAIATALRLPAQGAGSAMDQVAEALSARRFFLILDNLEHLAGGAGPLIRELLERVPTLTVLATSRQRLGLDFEREIAVPPLHTPSGSAATGELMDSPSVQLFVDRARAVNPAFDVTPSNASAVAQVCDRLEGIPLAIELCAAWAQTLTPAQMLEKLERRFDLLVSRRSDITPRHRTLRAALEYSYLQLPSDLQFVYKSVSVFRGSWSLEAAEAVFDEASQAASSSGDLWPALLALTELRERSLIVAEELDMAMRFRMLESLREFAGEQLSYAERAPLRKAHAGFYLRLAERADAETAASDQDRWLANLDQEQENLRAALSWSLETEDADAGLRLAGALGRYWSVRGALHEGVRYLERLLALPAAQEAPPYVQAKAWSLLGHLLWSQGDFASARTAHEQALELRRGAGDLPGIAESLYHMGITAYREDDFPPAQAFLEESLAISREQGDRSGIARVLLNLGNIAYEQQRYQEARNFTQQSLEIEQQLGNRRRSANALHNLGLIARDSGEYSLAETLIQEALTINRSMTDNYSAASTLANLGSTALLLGQTERARVLLAEGLRLAHDVGNKHIIAYYLLPMGLLEAGVGQWSNSVYLLSAAKRLLEQIGSALGPKDELRYDQTLADARSHLDSGVYTSIWTQGHMELLGQIVAKALALQPNLRTNE
jgi:predicted ATPase/DNA-binding SARP family transcriptional activator/Tfp pilus assembly protein PilF